MHVDVWLHEWIEVNRAIALVKSFETIQPGAEGPEGGSHNAHG